MGIETRANLVNSAGLLWLMDSMPPRSCGQSEVRDASAGLGQGPAACRPKLEDGEPFDRRVVRPSLRRDPEHAGVLDSGFLLEQSDLLTETFVFGLEADPRVPVVGRPATGRGDRSLGQRDGMDDRRADALGPLVGQWDAEKRSGPSHESPG